MEKEQNKKRLVVATGNIHKLREIAEIFPEYEVISGKQAGFSEEVEETGTTFAENAKLKAEAVSKALHCIALADDSGICVEALGALPAYTAPAMRADTETIRQTDFCSLKIWRAKQTAGAYFESAVALVLSDGECLLAEGRTYGKILFEETGENGFGYDCIFESEDLKKSFGLASAEEKNAVSHRFRALMNLSDMLKKVL